MPKKNFFLIAPIIMWYIPGAFIYQYRKITKAKQSDKNDPLDEVCQACSFSFNSVNKLICQTLLILSLCIFVIFFSVYFKGESLTLIIIMSFFLGGQIAVILYFAFLLYWIVLKLYPKD